MFDFNEVKKHEETRNNSVLSLDNMFLPQLQKLLDETFKTTKKSVSSFIDVKNKHVIIEGAYKIFPIKENITDLLKNILKDYTLIFRDCPLIQISNYIDINNNTCEFLTSFKNINMDKIDDNRSKIDKFPQDCNPQKFIKFINKINNPVITFSFLYNLKNLNQHISLQGKSLKIKVDNILFKLVANKQTNKQIKLIYDELIIVVDDIVSFDDLEILVRSILKNAIFTGHSIKLEVLHYFNKDELPIIEKKIKFTIDDRVSVDLKKPHKTK